MRSSIVTLIVLALTACGDGKPHTKGPCETQADCKDGTACLAFGDEEAACALECSISADDCGGEATCAGVGTIGVQVCQDNDRVTPDDEVPAEDDRPRIPCKKDADCEALDPGAVCAQFDGLKDCTIPCYDESDCDVPSAGGVTVDFFTCLPDESDSSRGACMPDESCWDDPLSCIDGLPSWTDPTGYPM